MRMKAAATLALLLVLAVGIVFNTYAQTCEECPPRVIMVDNVAFTMDGGGECMASRKVDCNTCSYEVWCIGGQWYRSQWEGCTLMYCGGGYKIEDPFK